MKDEILKIINTTIYYSDVTEGAKAAEELQRLMCYREVRAYCFGYKGNINNIADNIICAFNKGYPETMILEAIGKVKKEQ